MATRNGMLGEARWVVPVRGPQLVRWGSVLSGAMIALGVFALLLTLWLALSFSTGVSVVYDHLSWWVAGTAIACMFLAGLISGLTSGARGAGAGSANGLTTWGLVVLLAAVVLVPSVAIGHVPDTVKAGGLTLTISYLTYWTAFWGALIGLGAALFGGMIGGLARRRSDEPYLDLLDLARAEPVDATQPIAAQPVAVQPAAGQALASPGPVATPPVATQPVTAQPVPAGSVMGEGDIVRTVDYQYEPSHYVRR